MDSEDEGETVLGNLIQTEFLPTIISKLQQKPSVADVTICSTMLLGLIRAHEELLAILLSEADYVIPALRTAYTVLSGATSTDEVEGGLKKEAVRAKESILLFCAELVRAVRSESVREGLRGLAQVPGGMKVSEKMSGFLGKNSMGEDLGVYLAFELGSEKVEGGIDGSISQVLEQIADDDARGDPVSSDPYHIVSKADETACTSHSCSIPNTPTCTITPSPQSSLIRYLINLSPRDTGITTSRSDSLRRL